MELKPLSQFNGQFSVELSPDEHNTILQAIADTDLQGMDDDERRMHPQREATVMDEVRVSKQWNRRTAEIVKDTLDASYAAADTKVAAARAVLSSQIGITLEKYIRH